MTMTKILFLYTGMRRYYSLHILHTCMRESEKEGKNKKNNSTWDWGLRLF